MSGAAAEVEQTEFDVVLTGFGDKKLNVVKVVKNITGSSLMESKKLVESVPADSQRGCVQRRSRKGQRRRLKKLVVAVELK